MYPPCMIADSWSRESITLRRLKSASPRDTTEGEDRRVGRTAVAHRSASEADIRAVLGTIVIQRTDTNRLLQGHLRLQGHPLTPKHCRLEWQWSQAVLLNTVEICCVF